MKTRIRPCWSYVAVLIIMGFIRAQSIHAEPQETPTMKNVYEFSVKKIDGTATTLAEYKGKVLLIVNVASRCGFTGQYAGLEKIFETYKDRGLVVLGFPANDFLKQEPGSNKEIAEFCSTKFHVTFPMFEKIVVTGDDCHPLYRYLTEKATDPEFSGKITWNFNKFLIGRDGQILARFGSRTTPEDKELLTVLEKALDAKH